MKTKASRIMLLTPVGLAPAILYALVFLFSSIISKYYFQFLILFIFYFVVGYVALLRDLWNRSLSREIKVAWTLLNLFAGTIALPIYWCCYIMPDKGYPNNVPVDQSKSPPINQ
jgi:drug/metabolite transporter (DMT)-like permease